MALKHWCQVVMLSGLWLVGASACAESTTCEVGGRKIPIGHPFTCLDGCNGCVCQDEDTITTTAKGCPVPPGPAAGKLDCADQGWHDHGTVWACSDGGECTCNDGAVEKTDG